MRYEVLNKSHQGNPHCDVFPPSSRPLVHVCHLIGRMLRWEWSLTASCLSRGRRQAPVLACHQVSLSGYSHHHLVFWESSKSYFTSYLK